MKKERRLHPRIPAQLAGHIVCRTPGETLTIETRNISCSGLYCRVNKYIAPFTRLNVAMLLPIESSGELKTEMVDFEGVVVRTEPEEKQPGTGYYRTAIFFSGITEEARSLIARYVQQRMRRSGTQDPVQQ